VKSHCAWFVFSVQGIRLFIESGLQQIVNLPHRHFVSEEFFLAEDK